MAHLVVTQSVVPWYPFVIVVQLSGAGIAVGLVAGLVYVLLTRERTGVLAAHAGILVLPLVIIAYVGATAVGGSGLIAAFTCGVVAANHRPPFRIGLSELTRRVAREYASSTTIVVRALLFFSLGASLDLTRLNSTLLAAVALVLVLIFVARPIAVIACTMPDRNAKWGLRELALFSWTRETGIVPGALSALLLSQGVPGAQIVADVTAVAIVLTILLQATTTPWLVHKLSLSGPTAHTRPEPAVEPYNLGGKSG
jgi:cell volume regulation protein A